MGQVQNPEACGRSSAEAMLWVPETFGAMRNEMFPQASQTVRITPTDETMSVCLCSHFCENRLFQNFRNDHPPG